MPEQVTEDVDRTDELRFLRRVQRSGHSSLSVTLPQSWIASASIHPGDVLEFKELVGGRLELSVADVGRPPGARQKTLRIDIRALAPNLLARLLVGAFVTGYDRVLLLAREAFTDTQRTEVSDTVKRVLGMTLVEESANQIEVQISVDPGKHEFPRLVQRIARLLEQEVTMYRHALERRDPSVLDRLPLVEDEIDRFYLLMVRQLLLASDDFRVATDIGVTSHRFQIGSRVVAKMLEVIGDLLSDVGRELETALLNEKDLPPRAGDDLSHMLDDFDSFQKRTMEAYIGPSVWNANATLNDINRWLSQQYGPGDHPDSRVQPREETTTVRRRRVSWDLVMAVEMLVLVNEITINRQLEPETILRIGPGSSIVVPPESVESASPGVQPGRVNGGIARADIPALRPLSGSR